jgi:hypothetical protein
LGDIVTTRINPMCCCAALGAKASSVFLATEQGTLFEEEGSVQLASSLRLVFVKQKNIVSAYKAADLN